MYRDTVFRAGMRRTVPSPGTEEEMKMSRNWNVSLTVIAAVLIILILAGPLRVASVVLYRLGRIGMIAVLVMLTYALIRKKS